MPPKQDETKTNEETKEEETKTEETKKEETNTEETKEEETKEEETGYTINDIKPHPNNLDNTMCHYTYLGQNYSIHCNKLLVKENDEFEGDVFPKFKSDYNSWRNAYKNGDLTNCFTTDVSGGNPDISGNLKYNLSSCPEFTNFYKKTSMCKKAEKQTPGFTPYIGSTRDSDLQIFIKMFVTVICTTILFLVFVAMACASWVNTYKVSCHLYPPKDAFSGEDEDENKKKKVMECTDTSKYPYVGTKEEGKPGREYDCNQIKNYFRINFLHDFLEHKLYSKIVPSKLLVRSIRSFGKEYINPDGSENLDKYKAEHVTKILTDPKNVPKYDPKILYHFWKEKMIPDQKSKLIQVFERELPPLKKEHKDILIKKGDLQPGEETNDPYDIKLGELYEELEKEKQENGRGSGSSGSSASSESNARGAIEGMGTAAAIGSLIMRGGGLAAAAGAAGNNPLENNSKIPGFAKKMMSGDRPTVKEWYLKREIDNVKSYREKLLKNLKKNVKIGPNIAIPKNKWHGFTESKTFKLKFITVTALILRWTLLIWRTLHNIYMNIIAKVTKNPEGKGTFGKGFSFFLHFIVANPIFMGVMISFFGSLATTGGVLGGAGSFIKQLSETKNIANLENFGNKFLWFIHSIINVFGYNVIMFVIGAVIFSMILPYLLLFFPYHHAMTLMGSLRKSSEPDISVAETIHKSICRGVSFPFIIVLAGIMSVLFSEKRRYVPCVAGPMSEVNYQNKEFSEERQQDTDTKAAFSGDVVNKFAEKRGGNRNELFSTVLIATAVLILGYKKIMS